MGSLRPVESVPGVWPPPGDDESVRRTLAYARLRDPFGHAVHAGLAMLYLAMLPIATAPTGIAFAVLLFCALLRLHCTWRAYLYLLRDTVGWLLLALMGWMSLTVLWSSDPGQGWSEVWTLRVVATSFAIWPIIDRLPWLIGAFLVGVAGQNGVQFMQAMRWLGLEPDVSDRIGGLLHPTITGMMCLVALSWHLSAVLRASGWVRWVSLLAAGAAGLGLLVSGSRGPWVAALVILPLGLALIAWRQPQARMPAAFVAAAAVIFAAVAWPVAGDQIGHRIDDAVVEVQDAIDDEVYVTSTGLRLAMWQWSWDVFREHPIAGAGAGSFRAESAGRPSFQRAAERWPDEIDYLERDHPHNIFLHLMSTTGVVGLAIFGGVAVVVIVRCWTVRQDHVYASGMILVVGAWLIGGLFDCYNLNGQLMGLLVFVAVATLPHRPPARTDRPQWPGNRSEPQPAVQSGDRARKRPASNGPP